MCDGLFLNPLTNPSPRLNKFQKYFKRSQKDWDESICTLDVPQMIHLLVDELKKCVTGFILRSQLLSYEMFAQLEPISSLSSGTWVRISFGSHCQRGMCLGLRIADNGDCSGCLRPELGQVSESSWSWFIQLNWITHRHIIYWNVSPTYSMLAAVQWGLGQLTTEGGGVGEEAEGSRTGLFRAAQGRCLCHHWPPHGTVRLNWGREGVVWKNSKLGIWYTRLCFRLLTRIAMTLTIDKMC